MGCDIGVKWTLRKRGDREVEGRGKGKIIGFDEFHL